MTLALVSGMISRNTGVIVNVSSMGGRAGIAAESAYCASKFALCGWTESLAMDLWRTGIRVRLVLPGPIATDIWDRPGNDPAHYDGDLESPEKVARVIVDAINGDQFEYYVPNVKPVVEFKTSAIEMFIEGAVQYTESKDKK
jgi:short-subunit dehydrogenase